MSESYAKILRRRAFIAECVARRIELPGEERVTCIRCKERVPLELIAVDGLAICRPCAAAWLAQPSMRSRLRFWHVAALLGWLATAALAFLAF